MEGVGGEAGGYTAWDLEATLRGHEVAPLVPHEIEPIQWTKATTLSLTTQGVEGSACSQKSVACVLLDQQHLL